MMPSCLAMAPAPAPRALLTPTWIIWPGIWATHPVRSPPPSTHAGPAAGNVDLIVRGTLGGQLHGLLYQPATNNYLTDKTGLGPFTQAQLMLLTKRGDTVSIMASPWQRPADGR